MRSLIAKLVLTSQGPFKFSISRALYSIRRSWHARSIWIDWRLKENGIFISVDLSLSNICPTSSSRGYEILAKAIWRLPLLSMVDIWEQFSTRYNYVEVPGKHKFWNIVRCVQTLYFCTKYSWTFLTTLLVCFLVYLWNFAFHFAFWTLTKILTFYDIVCVVELFRENRDQCCSTTIQQSQHCLYLRLDEAFIGVRVMDLW